MKEIVKILMKRDGMSQDDAIACVKDFQENTLAEALDEEWSLCEIEEAFQGDFFLEPDYLISLLPI